MTRRASHRGSSAALALPAGGAVVPVMLLGTVLVALVAGLVVACAPGPAHAPGAAGSGAARDPAPVEASAAAQPVAAGPDDPSAGSAAPPAPTVGHRAADVLRTWDEARARAYAAGDARALRRLYVPGSRAGLSDVRVLRAYARRGLRVEGMRMQLLALEVLRGEPGLLSLRVTDRLVGAVAVRHVGNGSGERIALPRDAATSRVVVLGRVDGRWRVADVRSAGPGLRR